MAESVSQSTFKRNAHINYFLRCLRALPSSAQEHDANRITIAYFCISGLDLLGALDEKTTQEQRQGWTEWIWRLQHPSGGFRGSTFMTTGKPNTSPAHLPSTYTAILSLALLRASFDQLNIPGLKAFLGSCQADDGSFAPIASMVPNGDEGFQSDVRMTYCASVVTDIIGNHSTIDTSVARTFLHGCQTWEGGYATRPGVTEAQGGTTYCAITALHVLSSAPHRLDSLPRQDASLRWLLQRQIGGFQGRPGKLPDVCYSFWCGAAITILGHGDLIGHEADRRFLLSAQSPLGGFAKEPDEYPDPFHSYLALAALALSGASKTESASLGLRELDARWNVSVETAEWLKSEIRRIKVT